MADRKEKGEHAARQLHVNSALFSTRIALQKAAAPISALTPNTAPAEGSEDAAKSKHHLTRLAWEITQLQQEMLDALGTVAEGNETKKRKSTRGGAGGSAGANEEEEEEEENADSSEADDDDYDNNDDDASQPVAKKAKRTPFTDIKDEDALLDEMEEACQQHHQRLLPYLGKTVDKWHAKTQLANGKNKGFKVLNESLMVQIEEVGREKMRSHTTEKFDDTSFYLPMLREFLESKVDYTTMDQVEMARHYLELDALRAKVKKRVDTKASKGRKLRYHVHPKLVNFMASEETAYTSNTSENAKQGLFASLFKAH